MDPSLSSDLDCPSPSSNSAAHLPQTNNTSVCADSSVLTPTAAAARVQPIASLMGSQSLSRILMNVALPIILIGLSIVMYMMYKRRQTRLELEGGMCHLPTVVWRPRFMNYTTQEDDVINASGDELDWNNDNDDNDDNNDAIVEWAKDFLKEHRSTGSKTLPTKTTTLPTTTSDTNINTSKKKKMGSSSITNILPRMERLNGPYGMYATVYGIQTKVIHVAHPVPARAILTGVGGIDIGAMGDTLRGGRGGGGGGAYGSIISFLSYWKDAVLQIFHKTVNNNDHQHQTDQTANNPSQKKIQQQQQQKAQRLQLLRRKSSSLRMLTGSTKYPAYDHFKNFSGEGVFTANGSDWKAKRASVIHCLLRSGRSGGSNAKSNGKINNGNSDGNNSNGNTDRSLEMEANRAADSFEREVSAVSAVSRGITSTANGSTGENTTKSDDNNGQEETRSSPPPPVMNVVPMLQRSTIALIYRLVTHRNVDFGTPPDDDDDVVVADVGKASSADLTMTATTADSITSSSSTSSSTASLASSMGEDAGSNDDKTRTNDHTNAHTTNATATTSTKHNLSANYATTTNNNNNNITKNDENKKRESKLKSLLPTYLASVTKIRMIVLAQSRSIWYLLPRSIYKAFSPMYREEERTMGPIREFARLTCESAKEGSPLALLSRRSSHSSSSASSSSSSTTATPHDDDNGDNGNGVPLKVSKDLLDEAITLLFAGQDTSAATLSWTLHLLSLHPEKQTRAAEEVRSVLGETTETATSPVIVSKSMISRMPYLDAVIKESMRLYPVAPFIVRKLTTDIAIPNDDESPTANNNGNARKTISMPASTFACIWIYALHRNPKLWTAPDDFLPERWIDPELRKRDVGQKEIGAYMPFAIGPRNCLGQPLAQVILRIVLARIMYKYVAIDPKLEALEEQRKVEVEDEEEGGEFDSRCLRKDMQAGFTVLPSGGLKLRLMER